MSQQFVAGTPVYSATGNRVGTVSAEGVRGGYLLVQKGRIFHQTLYVPLDAIRRIRQRGIYLRLYKPYVTQPDEKVLGTKISPVAFNDENTLVPTTDTWEWPRFTTVADENDDLRIPLREERLVAEKQQREQRRVHVHKYIVEEPQTITVPVTHEKLSVKRVQVKGHVDPGPNVFTEKHIELPLMGEALTVDKRTEVVEEIQLFKSRITEDHEVNDVVRKERLQVDGMDDPTQQMQSPGHLH